MSGTKQPVSNQESGTRPPVVVVLGHVDHGKTSILDAIRQTKVTAGEAGGITQHIGAYQAEHQGKKITFLDTPGHEAFSAIRSRGTRVADIAILVVAADEGVKPQTKEAISIIREANVPFIVAINKIDKEQAQPARVRQELAENEVLVEGYGGQVPVIELSAKTGTGIDALLEMILLVAELAELPSITDVSAQGVIIESHKDPQRGSIATGLIQTGMLHVGDWIVAGSATGRVKSLNDFLGKPIHQAGPSEPCTILGWTTIPHLGAQFHVADNRKIAEEQAQKAMAVGPTVLFVAESSSADTKTNKKIKNIIIKADVNSSLEAIDQVLRTIHSEEVMYRVINYGVGEIGVADIQNAKTTGASVVGFHVDYKDAIKQIAEREHVDVLTFDIIYELVQTVRERMAELLDPIVNRIPRGKIRVLAFFRAEGKTQIIGGKVIQGKAVRGALADVLRNSSVIMHGRLGQVQHNKIDTAEVAEGLELGVRFDILSFEGLRPMTISPGDTLDIYQEEQIKRTL